MFSFLERRPSDGIAMKPPKKEVLSNTIQMSSLNGFHCQNDQNDFFNNMTFHELDNKLSEEAFDMDEDKCDVFYEPKPITRNDGKSHHLAESIDKLRHSTESKVTTTSSVGISDFPGGCTGNTTISSFPLSSAIGCADFEKKYVPLGYMPKNEWKADAGDVCEQSYSSFLSHLKGAGGVHRTNAQAHDVQMHKQAINLTIAASYPTVPKSSADKESTLPLFASCPKREQCFWNYHEENWKKMFKVFCDFRKTNGHSLVPHTFDPNPRLAQWVKRQRRQYKLYMEGKKSSMTQQRRQKLEEVGFIWDSQELLWETRFQELQEYKRNHGDCNVPSNFPKNRQLSIWVKRQRRQYKLFWSNATSSMNLERIAKLSNIGFSWEIRRRNGPLRTP